MSTPISYVILCRIWWLKGKRYGHVQTVPNTWSTGATPPWYGGRGWPVKRPVACTNTPNLVAVWSDDSALICRTIHQKYWTRRVPPFDVTYGHWKWHGSTGTCHILMGLSRSCTVSKFKMISIENTHFPISCIFAPVEGVTIGIFSGVWYKELEWCVCHVVKTVWHVVQPFWHYTSIGRTDR